jgi:purine nucleosidase
MPSFAAGWLNKRRPLMERLIIDTDPGVDDAHAILMAFAHPNAKVEALTTVTGNVTVDKTTANALRLVEASGVDCPVYAGCRDALVADVPGAAEFHGQDGLGDSGLPFSTRKAQTEHAVNALVRMANAEPGQLTLVGIAPLTNIAMAIRLDPDLPRKFKRLVLMGGSINGQGNTTPSAEFNIYKDPEAAAVVFAAWPEITLVSWETTLSHAFSAEQLDTLWAAQTARGEFFRRISAKTVEFITTVLGQKMLVEPDFLAVAAAIESDVVTKAEKHAVTIELAGTHTRGMTAVDWFGMGGAEKKVNLVLEMNRARLWEMLQWIVK